MLRPSTTPESQSRGAVSHVILFETLVVVVTLVLCVILVPFVVYLPRIFLDVQGQPLVTPSVRNYVALVGGYLRGLLHGDLGTTHRGMAMTRALLVPARHSLQLMSVSFAVALPLGIGWGALLARRRHGLPAWLLFGLSTLVISLPSFIVLLLTIQAIATLTLRTHIRLTYVQGYGLDRHLLVPTAVLALQGAGYMARAFQVAQEEIVRQDWIMVARAKGLGGLTLWWRHILPALRWPVIASSLGMLRIMVSGLIMVDYMYNWGGLGQLLLTFGTGEISPTDSNVAASAALVVVLFFVITDLLGRLLAQHPAERIP